MLQLQNRTKNWYFHLDSIHTIPAGIALGVNKNLYWFLNLLDEPLISSLKICHVQRGMVKTYRKNYTVIIGEILLNYIAAFLFPIVLLDELLIPNG